MHTVEILDQAITAAQLLGVKIRQEWLGGDGGGGCEIRGQKWVFLDLTQSPAEHLAQVVDTIRGEPGLSHLDLPPELTRMLEARRAA